MLKCEQKINLVGDSQGKNREFNQLCLFLAYL